MTLQEIKTQLRDGPYAWPGGYPKFFVTNDGDVLSFQAVRNNWCHIVGAHLRNVRDGWMIAGCDINWEDDNLYCADTGEKIEAAYTE